ncbi:hemagglutinin repeat-containing protein [uncultured Oxalicibacterium sp.]|uniref:hemagglutinin repeat-containing protein n=1 Tax=uncultured Oxalicibacterium sp. TaxID=1168540 RepID=UPI0025DBFA9E|nr:hemagglutinin repeat-containing protein [uncultured Oxalicibacterium sp.]
MPYHCPASAGRGNADGKDVTWTNTHVNAGNQLALVSGKDANLIGAVASGKQVTADVGGDLNIQSLQDTSEYDSKQKNVGGSITIGAGVSGSISYSKSKVSSDYARVTETSGIKAGDGGFQVDKFMPIQR